MQNGAPVSRIGVTPIMPFVKGSFVTLSRGDRLCQFQPIAAVANPFKVSNAGSCGETVRGLHAGGRRLVSNHGFVPDLIS